MAYGREDSPSSGRPQGSSLGGPSRSGAGGAGGTRRSSSGTQRESQGSVSSSSRAGAGPQRSSAGGQGGQGGNFGRGDTPSSGRQTGSNLGGRQGGAERTGPGMGFQGGDWGARARAVSRGPGLLGSMQSLDPADQQRALTSIGLSLGRKLGLPEGTNLGIDKATLAAKTAAGEVGRYGQLDYDAVARTMMNRMDLMQSGATMFGRDFDKMMQAYDANRTAPRTQTKKGLKQTKGAYAAYTAAEPGTPTFQKGLYSIANAMSPYSAIAQSPVAAATHYYSGPRTAAYQKGFERFGASGHKFGNPDYSQSQVEAAQNRALGGPTSPLAGAAPTSGIATTAPAPGGYGLPRAKPDLRGLTMGMPRAKPALPAAFSGPPVLANPYGVPRPKPPSPALTATTAQAFSTARPMTLTLDGGPLRTLGTLGRRGRRSAKIY